LSNICTIYVQNHIVKHTIHFYFWFAEESEPRWFFFAGFHFLGCKGGGGDSWPMANLATWCLPVSGMTSSFMNPNNCSCTARILCGVRYCLLKSICCNFKNQRSEVSSMCIGIKIQNKPHMHQYVTSIFYSSYVFLLMKWNIEYITQKTQTLIPCFCW
jgi:hypothetical protein